MYTLIVIPLNTKLVYKLIVIPLKTKLMYKLMVIPLNTKLVYKRMVIPLNTKLQDDFVCNLIYYVNFHTYLNGGWGMKTI